jgi:peptidoglycan/LPS O-acetylase OafA/YrhL
MQQGAPSGRARIHEMDGLRGWAALSVVLAHLVFGVFRNVDPPLAPQSVRLLLEPFLGGTLDFAVFFVLSGDALSANYWTRQSREDVARLTVSRYFRLFIPILASCLVVFALIESGLTFNHQASPLVNSDDFLGVFLRIDPTLLDVLNYAAFGVFFHHTADASLNPFLGTMQPELLGSIVAFLYLFVDPYIRSKIPVLAFGFLVCLGGGSFLACFPFGLLCGRFRAQGGFAWLRRQRAAQVLAPPVAVAATVLGTWCNRLWPGWLMPSILASCVLVFSVYASTALTGFFANALSRRLGRISYPLFLIHFPVIASFTSGMILLAHEHHALTPATIWSIILGSAVLSLIAAKLFQPIEKLTARIGDRVWRAAMQGDVLAASQRQLGKVNIPSPAAPAAAPLVDSQT